LPGIAGADWRDLAVLAGLGRGRRGSWRFAASLGGSRAREKTPGGLAGRSGTGHSVVAFAGGQEVEDPGCGIAGQAGRRCW